MPPPPVAHEHVLVDTAVGDVQGLLDVLQTVVENLQVLQHREGGAGELKGDVGGDVAGGEDDGLHVGLHGLVQVLADLDELNVLTRQVAVAEHVLLPRVEEPHDGGDTLAGDLLGVIDIEGELQGAVGDVNPVEGLVVEAEAVALLAVLDGTVLGLLMGVGIDDLHAVARREGRAGLLVEGDIGVDLGVILRTADGRSHEKRRQRKDDM